LFVEFDALLQQINRRLCGGQGIGCVLATFDAQDASDDMMMSTAIDSQPFPVDGVQIHEKNALGTLVATEDLGSTLPQYIF
jgi:hypothetical protein